MVESRTSKEEESPLRLLLVRNQTGTVSLNLRVCYKKERPTLRHPVCAFCVAWLIMAVVSLLTVVFPFMSCV